ncbi:MAG: CDP-alcohol phosphatidyltransferase family protein [Mobilitalea sp.]
MKNVPNLITIARILGTMFLLIIKPFSQLFLIVYFLCGVTDVVDGVIARKFNLVSKKGQILDSIADCFMITVLLLLVILNFNLPLWSLFWVVIIAIIRLSSLIVGFIRYRQLAFLHTYANKTTGFVLFCYPFLYVGLGFNQATILVSIIASISAIEELMINFISKGLCRDIKSIFSLK